MSVMKPAVLDTHILDWGAAMAQQLEGEIRVMHCFNVLPHSAIFDEHVVADFEKYAGEGPSGAYPCPGSAA